MLNLLLPGACALLLVIIALQDFLVPALRQKTISSGLTGPYDGLLLAAFAVLSGAMIAAFWHAPALAAILAISAAGSLVLTGVSGHLATTPQIEKWHTIQTAVTFVFAIALQFVCNGHDPKLWTITFGGIVYAVTTHFLVPNASVTEKVGVTGMCLWLIAWSL